MYDNGHSPGQEELLIDTMKMAKATGDPWELVLSEEVRLSCLLYPDIDRRLPVLPEGSRRGLREPIRRVDLARG